MDITFVIEAKDLHKVYFQGRTKVEALRGVDLRVKYGQSMLIVGPSGAGKSTLLHILGGLDMPTVGSVEFEGKDLCILSDKKRASIRNERIGFIFQFYHLLPEFTAVENVMLPAMIRGSRPKGQGPRERACELLGLVGLGNRVRHKPRELSGGEAQRVAIARALMNDPQVLLCDEPTGNLDSESGGKIFDILFKLNKEKMKTLIVVSHDERMREDFNDVYYIRDGKLCAGREFVKWV